MKGESDMAILTASHLKKYYGKDESLVKALDDVNVSIEDGQFAAVIGTSGSVRIEGNKLEEMSEEAAHCIPQEEDRIYLSEL